MGASPLAVLMPVYNAAEFLAEAIDSVLAQSYRDFRFVIVDDGSTDDSATIIAERAERDSRILLIGRENGGVTAALNTGLAAIDAGYVARMDADDIAFPERLARQVARLEGDPALAVLGTGVQAMDRAGHPRHVRPVTAGSAAVATALPVRNVINHPSVMMRTAVLKAAGGYRERYRNSQDYDLWLRLIGEGKKLDNLDEILLHYRTYEGRASSAQNRVRQTVYSVAAATNFFCRKYGLPASDAPIDIANPSEITAALTALLALDLSSTDATALYRHSLRLVRNARGGHAVAHFAATMRRQLLSRHEYGQLAKLAFYSVRARTSRLRSF